jgi:hypothetical protein
MTISLFQFAVTHIEPELAREFGADWMATRENLPHGPLGHGVAWDAGWPLDLTPRQWEAEFMAWVEVMGLG